MHVAAIVIGAVLAATSVAAPAADDDQARADAAIDGFTARMVDLGFVIDDNDDRDDEDGDAPRDNDDTADDTADTADTADDCFVDAGLEYDDDQPLTPTDGDTTAEAESPELEFPAEVALSTDPFEALGEVPETIGAMVSMFDAADVDAAGAVVDWLGSKEAARCFERQWAAEMFGEADPDDPATAAMTPELDVTSRRDIGVGDRSARIDMDVSMRVFVTLEFRITMVIAQSGRSSATVMHVSGADGPTSGVDPVAELELLIDALDEPAG